jgi:hypothetical protein
LEPIRDLLTAFVVVAVVSFLVAVVWLALLVRRLGRLDLPADATLVETLRAVPLGLVVALDLLDLSLDFLSAPISWAVLSRLRLQALRQVTLLEAVIPATQFIPLLTGAWLYARYVAPPGRGPRVVEGRARPVEPGAPRLGDDEARR